MKKSTIDNMKLFSIVAMLTFVIAGLLLVFLSSPVTTPEQIPAYKEWRYSSK